LKYIGKHWRGEHTLAVSFWVNLFLINTALRIVEGWLTIAPPIENPVIYSQVTITYVFISLIVVYPWQIIGLWRSADRHVEETKRIFWTSIVRVLVVMGVFATLGDLGNSLPTYKNLYQIGFEKDEFGDYQIELIEDSSLIHLRGGLGFGVSKDINHLLAKSPNVKGIILDSYGGRIYEGRELSEIILINSLDTYSLEGCYSACGTAFISGNKRFLGTGANLAFHQYHGYDSDVDMSAEESKDLIIYQEQGIAKNFIDRVFKAEQDDLWYPTVDEMLSTGVIHGVVNPSDLKPVEHGSLDTTDLEKVLATNSAFHTIKKYEPEVYKQLIEKMVNQMKEGVTLIEIEQSVGDYLQSPLNKALPKTSNSALITYIRTTIKMLDKLEKTDPILCMKSLFSEQYGAIEMSKHLTIEEMQPPLDALSLVIKDSYETTPPMLDLKSAEDIFSEVLVQLGEDAQYLGAENLENKDDYSKSCKAVMKFYELILLNDDKSVGNTLRYIFSE
jgi:hypothetical protein